MWSRGAGRVVIVHEEPRGAVSGLVSTPLVEITVVSTHLSFLPGWNAVQPRRLRRDLATLPDPLVLMGNLNRSGDRPVRVTGYRTLALVPTFPSERPTRQLDHILLRGDLVPVSSLSSPHLPLSDHRPHYGEAAGERVLAAQGRLWCGRVGASFSASWTVCFIRRSCLSSSVVASWARGRKRARRLRLDSGASG